MRLNENRKEKMVLSVIMENPWRVHKLYTGFFRFFCYAGKIARKTPKIV